MPYRNVRHSIEVQSRADFGELSLPFREFAMRSDESAMVVGYLRQAVAVLSIHQGRLSIHGDPIDQEHANWMWQLALGIASHIDPSITDFRHLSAAGMPVYPAAVQVLDSSRLTPSSVKYPSPFDFASRETGSSGGSKDFATLLRQYVSHGRYVVHEHTAKERADQTLIDGMSHFELPSELLIQATGRTMRALDYISNLPPIPTDLPEVGDNPEGLRFEANVARQLVLCAQLHLFEHALGYAALGHVVMDEINVDTFDPVRGKADSLGSEVAIRAILSVKRGASDDLLLRAVAKAIEAELPGISTSSLRPQEGYKGKEL